MPNPAPAVLRLDRVSLDLPVNMGASAQEGAHERFGHRAREGKIVHVLRDVSLTISEGNRVALIGRNGSGKSSLLRLLAAVFTPTEGSIAANGRMATLIDPTFGFYPELRGVDNIQLYLRSHGVPKNEFPALKHEIAEFAQLGPFLSLPVGTYSSGMQMRLAFALAMAVRPTILLMDEWIFTGDATFVETAFQRLESVLGRTGVLVISTHIEELAARWCDRGIWLESGSIARDGPIDAMSAPASPLKVA